MPDAEAILWNSAHSTAQYSKVLEVLKKQRPRNNNAPLISNPSPFDDKTFSSAGEIGAVKEHRFMI